MEHQARQMRASLDAIINWMLHSGIQNTSGMLKGSVNAWFNLDTKTYSYVYSEITGYAITTFLFLNKIYPDDEFVRRAKEAAEWAINEALHPCGGVRTRQYSDETAKVDLYSFENENIFAFDTGMVLFGMVNLYRETAKEEYLQACRTMANFLIEKMQNENGSLAAIYNVPDDRIIDSQDKWSSQAAGFLAKDAMGLIDLFAVTGDKQYREAAVKLCDFALTTQDDAGRFITDRATQTTHLHPHCYSAEGLMYLGSILKLNKYIESAQKATQWALSHVTENGVNELYNLADDSFNDIQRSDILAQLLRLSLLFAMEEKQEFLKKRLLQYQYKGDEVSQQGGFLFNLEGHDVNSWCTMFALQALALCEDKNLILKDQILNLLV